MVIKSFNRCPSCKTGLVFENLIKLNKHCSVCKFNFRLEKVGDLISWGTSFFLSIMIIPLVLVLEFKFKLNFFEKVLVVLPVTFFLTIAILRYFRIFILKKYYLASKRDA